MSGSTEILNESLTDFSDKVIKKKIHHFLDSFENYSLESISEWALLPPGNIIHFTLVLSL